MEQDGLLTETEAARFLSVGASSMQRWRREERGPKYIRISARRLAYRRNDLIAWLDGLQQSGEKREAAE